MFFGIGLWDTSLFGVAWSNRNKDLDVIGFLYSCETRL